MLKLLLGYIVVVYVDVGGQECGVGVAMAGNVGVVVADNDMFFPQITLMRKQCLSLKTAMSLSRKQRRTANIRHTAR